VVVLLVLCALVVVECGQLMCDAVLL